MKHQKPQKPQIRIRCRKQTAEEQRRFVMAAELLLAELVRQRLARNENGNEYKQ